MQIGALISMVSGALDIIGKFGGNARAAKVAGHVQDAIAVVGALTPLVREFTNGHEVSADDVRDALDGMDDALNEFDRLIAAKGA